MYGNDPILGLILSKLEQIENRIGNMEAFLEQSTKIKETFNGDQLLDNQDMCRILNISKRTLQRYREERIIPYYRISGKTYYKSSEVEGFLKTFESKKT